MVTMGSLGVHVHQPKSVRQLMGAAGRNQRNRRVDAGRGTGFELIMRLVKSHDHLENPCPAARLSHRTPHGRVCRGFSARISITQAGFHTVACPVIPAPTGRSLSERRGVLTIGFVDWH